MSVTNIIGLGISYEKFAVQAIMPLAPAKWVLTKWQS
jgi:hypothetical protein